MRYFIATVLVLLSLACTKDARNAGLDVTITGQGTVSSDDDLISCPPACSSGFERGATVTLTASPTTGWQFVRWRGACDGAAECTIVVDGDIQVFADFEQPPTVNANVTVVGPGRVFSEPSGIDCPGACVASFLQGSTATFTLSSAPFLGWYEDCSGATCGLQMNGDRNVLAAFGTTGEVWDARGFGSSSFVTQVTDIAVDPNNGDVVIVGVGGGAFEVGGVPIQAGNAIGFVARLDAYGDARWVRTYGDPTTSFANAVHTVGITSNGELYVGGYVTEDADLGGGLIDFPDQSEHGFVVKLTADGQYLWHQLFLPSYFPITESVVHDLAVGETRIVVAGSIGPGPLTDSLVLAFDPDGNELWIAMYGSPNGGARAARAVALFDTEDALVAHGFTDSIDLTGSGLIYTSAGSEDVLLIAHDSSNGAFGTIRHLADIDDVKAVEIAIEGTEAYVGGLFQTELDVGLASPLATQPAGYATFVVNYDVAAADQPLVPDWAIALDGAQLTSNTFPAVGMTADSTGVTFATSVQGNVQFGSTMLNSSGSDVAVGHVTPTGQPDWIRSFGGDTNDWGEAIAIDASGNCVVGGSVYSADVVFDDYTLTVGGGIADAFVARLGR